MGFVFVIVSLVATLIQIAIKRPKDRATVIDVFLLHSLVFNVGFVGFIPHVFFSEHAAARIDWEAGSHFQYEVGFHDGAWGTRSRPSRPASIVRALSFSEPIDVEAVRDEGAPTRDRPERTVYAALDVDGARGPLIHSPLE
jgi:hypothetical protein